MIKSATNQSQGMLLFQLTLNQSFAIGTLKVKEIVPYTPLTVIPHSHSTVLGAATLRGQTFPVIDMAKAVGYRALVKEEVKDCYIIITDCQRKLVGFMVRGINKITECNWHEIDAPPVSLGNNVFVTGVTTVEDNLVQLLDVELLMSKIFPEDPNSLNPVLTDIEREILRPLKILLVDDSSVARRQLSQALDSISVPYFISTNGQDALNMMKNAADNHDPFQILVSDIEMPGLDGYELAFDVKNTEKLKSVYIILHTSLSSEISVSQAHQVGADEALTKFEANELIHAMLRGAERHTVVA
ncbi:chemotaxis protein [Photobacterium indicum]|jgi:two-component system, chemotaxis family, chemotaxis protein CheV|uniref:Chemotaxis protein CheW n=1 Tax=Photobacterium indicum TaxID=81447 RepID=A0A2T3L8V7_9GAMM|nr:chemotaxis protein [Photobacterium indicum]PSV47418.1 chemotaxis protein CheW [Photobacterium indicum]